MYSPDEISTETRTISIKGKPFLVSIVSYHKTLLDPQEAAEKVGAAYQHLAEEFLANPLAEEQKSACVISNLTPIAQYTNQALIDAWFENVNDQNVQTQHWLRSLFGRPAFQITAIKNVDVRPLNDRNAELNASSNPMIYSDSMEDAVERATDLLRIAHRL